jgi:uncharacterized protein (TIGR02246 family)
MSVESEGNAVAATMDLINKAWLDGDPEAMAPCLHADIVMVFPGFEGRIAGRDSFIAGFHDFVDHAVVHEYQEAGRQIDTIGNTAVVTFSFKMIYERGGQKYRSTGRDVWIFQKTGTEWLAVWRTMLDVNEEPE